MYTQGTHLLRRVNPAGIYFDTADLLAPILGWNEIWAEEKKNRKKMIVEKQRKQQRLLSPGYDFTICEKIK